MKRIKLLNIIFLIINISIYAQNSEELNNLSKLNFNNDINKAEELAKQAYKISFIDKKNEQIAVSLKNIGICKYLKYDLDSAKYYYLKSEEYYKIENNKSGLAKIYNNIAIIKNLQNDNEQAIILYNKALLLNIEIGDSSEIANNYLNIGTVYDRLNKHNVALQYYKKALNGKIDTFTKISILINIGAVYGSLNKKNEAVKTYKEALNLSEKTNNEYSTCLILNNIANNLIQLNELQKVENILNTSLKISKKYNYKEFILHSYMLLGNLKYKKELYNESLSHYFRVLNLVKESPSNVIEYKTYKQISETYTELNNVKKAFQFYKKYTILKDSIVNNENIVKISELQAKYKSEKQQTKISKLKNENKFEKLKNSKKNFIIAVISFSLLFIILIIAILFLRYKNKQQKAKHKLEKQGFELEQRMLRSQMNPHFIFNALNSIQSFLATNNTLNAEIFLSKFALLIRNILENSSKEFVDFEKELETIDLYIQLEQLRFNEKFSYKFVNNLEDNFLKIPPMLIQPIVENAILHGLRNKETNGKLTIEFYEFTEREIICNVIDNGIGRKASLKNKKNKHNSVATKLTNDRLKYFTKKKISKAGIKFIDLYNDKNKAIGTKVEIILPFKLK